MIHPSHPTPGTPDGPRAPSSDRDAGRAAREQSRISAALREDPQARRLFRAALVLMIVIGSLGAIALHRFATIAGVGPAAAIVIATVGAPILALALYGLAMPRIVRPMLRRAERAAGRDVCVTCGYRLDGLAGAACPECGREDQPTLGSPPRTPR